MKFRKLRIAFSATCLAACVLLIAFWVRSYRTVDSANIPMTTTWSLDLVSLRGLIGIGKSGQTSSWDTMQMPLNEWQAFVKVAGLKVPSSTWGGLVHEKNSTGVYIPCWMLITLGVTLAILPWIRWSNRFSLRTLLIATTLVAVMLGLIVWISRAG